MKVKHVFISFVLGMGVVLVLLSSLGDWRAPVVAASRTAAELRVCPAGCAHSSVQAAVDAAGDGDVIKVAGGTYTGVSARAGVTQMVYISKTVTVRGGYTPANWTVPDPSANPSLLDAQGQGRVFYVTGDPSAGPGQAISVTIAGLRITGGDAAGLGGDPWMKRDTGGGVYAVAQARVTLADNCVFGNSADNGGGMGVFSTTVTLLDNQIYGNAATASGGGVYAVNAPEEHAHGITVTIVGNRVFSNTAARGGGMYVENRAYTVDDCPGSVVAVVADNQVFGNAAAQGGGVLLYNSATTFTGNTITTNTALYAGGGLYAGHDLICAGGSDEFAGNTFAANTAGYGGGLYLYLRGSTFRNTVVIDNRADIAGGGMYPIGSTSHWLHSTIARNGGSGVWATWSFGTMIVPTQVTLTNSIIVSQTVGVTMTGDRTAPWSIDTLVLDGVLWSGNGTNITATGLVTVTRAYTGDPVFAADGYHLAAGSAAIDRGACAGVGTDIDGEPRSPIAGCDLGADEFPFALAVSKRVTPTLAAGGERLTYTIRVTNTGSAELHASISDTLPTRVTPGGWVTWTAAITAPGGVWGETVVVTVGEGYAGPLVNLVEVGTVEGAAGEDWVVVNFYGVYLPLVVRM